MIEKFGKKSLAACIFAFMSAVSTTSNASDLAEVEAVVKLYASTVACSYEGSDFKAVQVAGDKNEPMSFMDYYTVVWSGDLGCSGGSGSHGVIMTTVGSRAGGNLKVLADKANVMVPTRTVKAVAGAQGMVIIEGPAYRENDPNCCPSGTASYVYKFDQGSETMKLVEE
ncbi:hypothetical protein [Marinobacterium marinum]|uniref:Uncharacterized protein n=1 Tax=Marinobacterium marinum TaxID=2756129 RepID=A0A7W2AAE1_9GAMM|nr:hypothetical protein [Marinobacterium marinum]MBA4500895.1 hypothetical protein [Marinobacterium marinum]